MIDQGLGVENSELAYEKARYDYIIALYEGLLVRKEAIERRVSFQLLIITLMVGLIFSNTGTINKLNDFLMSNKDIKLLFLSNTLVFLLAVTLIVSLTLIIVILVRFQYQNAPSKDLLTSIYFPNSESSQRKDPLAFYQRVGVVYAVNVERITEGLIRIDSLCRLSTISLASAIFILGMVIIIFTLGIPIV